MSNDTTPDPPLTPGSAGLGDLRAVMEGAPLALAEGWRGPVEAAAAALAARMATPEAIYGVNTGFGKLANTRIPTTELATLQLNLVRSPCRRRRRRRCRDAGRAAHAAAQGRCPWRAAHSGVRPR